MYCREEACAMGGIACFSNGKMLILAAKHASLTERALYFYTCSQEESVIGFITGKRLVLVPGGIPLFSVRNRLVPGRVTPFSVCNRLVPGGIARVVDQVLCNKFLQNL